MIANDGPHFCSKCREAKATCFRNKRHFCRDCWRLAAFLPKQDPEHFVQASQKLAEIGSRIFDESVESITRLGNASGVITNATSQAVAEQSERPPRERTVASYCVRADEILATDLHGLLDDGEYGIHCFPYSMNPFVLARIGAENESMTVADAIDMATDPEVREALSEGLRFFFDDDFDFGVLRKATYRFRLTRVNLLHLTLGIGRMVELAQHLEEGRALPARFAGDERQLYLDLHTKSARCGMRTWYDLRFLAYDLRDRNNRAEELIPLWLLHPLPGSLSRDLVDIRRTYIEGSRRMCLIMCRATLERAVGLALRAGLNDSDLGLEAMIDRLADTGNLSKSDALAAHRVRMIGNAAVHGRPTADVPAIDVIRDLFHVLHRLHGSPMNGHP